MVTPILKLKILFLLGWVVFAVGCAATPEPKDYTKFNAINPRSILIVPVVNRSVEVDAPDYFLTTIPIPLAEQGYYIFPVNMVKRVMEDDGLADADLVHNAPTPRLCDLFGADAVLYVSIENWEAAYIILTTTITVEMNYKIRDCKNGEELWAENQKMVYQPPSVNTGNLIGNLVAMAITAAAAKAAPNYRPLAQQANAKAFTYPGPGIPPGPYKIVKDKEDKEKAEAAPSDDASENGAESGGGAPAIDY